MKRKHVAIAVLVTYLIMSFVPSLGLMSLIGRFGGGKKSG